MIQYLLSFLVILFVVFWTSRSQYEWWNKEKAVQFLQNAGFIKVEIQKNSYPSEKIYARKEDFKGTIIGRREYPKTIGFLISSKIRFRYGFRIEKINYFESLNSNSNRMPGFPRDIQVISLNTEYVQKLLMDENVLPFIKAMKKNIVELVVSDKSIKMTLKPKFSAMKFGLQFAENLIQAQKPDKMTVANCKENIEDYICNECGEITTMYVVSCNKCGQPAPICVVCFNDPEPGEDIVRFTCCKSYGHIDHIKAWISRSSSCPYCRSTKPIYSKVHGF